MGPSRMGPAYWQNSKGPAHACGESSQKKADSGPPVPIEHVYKVVDAIDVIANQTGKTVTQIALNWLLQKPTVSGVIIGARNEEQLRQNLGAADWKLTPEQLAALDAACQTTPAYPYWHQRQFVERIPLPVGETLAA
jgi:aryl-alcohol dehydrogenase-like predicted oxidoreductase